MRGAWYTTSGGGGGLGLAVIIAAVLAASAITRALEVVLIILGSIIALAVTGGITWLVYPARQDRPRRPIAARAVSREESAARPQQDEPRNRAIGRARELHLHVHGLTPEQIAAIVTQRGAYPEDDR